MPIHFSDQTEERVWVYHPPNDKDNDRAFIQRGSPHSPLRQIGLLSSKLCHNLNITYKSLLNK